jgi:hypothetical protein
MWEAEIKRFSVPGQPRQKNMQDSISMEKTGRAGECLSYLSCDRKGKVGGSWSTPAQTKNETLSQK